MSAPLTPAGQHTVRRHNAQLVLTALATGTASRAVLAQRTGLTKSTVSSLVDSLIAQRILIEGKAEVGGPGRPSRPVGLNPHGLLALGVEINVDYLAAGLLDLTGVVRDQRRLDLDNRALSVSEIVSTALTLARDLIGESSHIVLGAGLAVPGVVDAGGVVLRAPNLPALAGHDLAATITSGLNGLVARVENEANCGALARLRDSPTGQDFVYVSGEIGVGSGIVLGGALFRGANGFAGELGHVVVDRDGPECACGGNGCVEQYAGLQAMLSRSGQESLQSLSAALSTADPKAVSAVQQAGAALGVGLSSMLNLLDLPLVVLGGMYAELFAEITPALTGELDRRVLSEGRQVQRAGFGADAAVRGAAGMVIDSALSDPEAVGVSIG